MPSQAERLLAEADRQLVEAKARVARQERLIARMAAAGEDTTLSRELLAVLEESLDLTRQRRELILAEIAAGSL
jgi:hypothetical protein